MNEEQNNENVKNLIFVPEGCSYFLDTTVDQEHIGLITQGCNTCACIIVENQENTKMVLTHVDSGNNLTNTEFGLPKWIEQCGGGVAQVKIHLGCAKGDREYEKYNEIIKTQFPNISYTLHGDASEGGMILKNGYKIINDPISKGRLGTVNNYKILQNPQTKQDRIIFNDQISFNERATHKLCPYNQRTNGNIIHNELEMQTQQQLFDNFNKYFNEKIQKPENITGDIYKTTVGLIKFEQIKQQLDYHPHIENKDSNEIDFKGTEFKFNDLQNNNFISEYQFLENLKEKQCLNTVGIQKLNYFNILKDYNTKDNVAIKNSLDCLKKIQSKTTDDLPSKTIPSVFQSNEIKRSKSCNTL